MVLMLALAFAAGLASRAEAQTTLVGMRAEPTAEGAVITLQLSSPVTPRPAELIDNPTRLFFDLPGVTPGRQRVLQVAHSGVAQVRAALNQPAPPLTRVVIELDARMEWRVEPGAAPHEIRVRLWRQPSTRATVIDRRQQIMTDVRALAPAFEAIRAGAGPGEQELGVILKSLEEMSTAARAMQTSGLQSDLMLVSTIDGMMNAVRARLQALLDNQAQSRANAISAAQGALLLLGHIK